MHNPAMAALGLDWRYLAFDVHPDSLAEAIAGAKRMGFIGLNLTVPHKLLAVPLVDELDSSAQTWGAVNTVIFEGLDSSDSWKPLRECNPASTKQVRSRGYNTDADAIVRSIQEDLALALKASTVLLLGAGGAGRTAALKLAEAGARKLYLVNRTQSKAVAIANEIVARYPGVSVVPDYPTERVDLVLNATSLGLKTGDSLPFDPISFSLKSARNAYDMIYRPAETPFLSEAAKAGCRTANGLGMLLYQGAKALEIWTGQTAPVDVMRHALTEHIYGGH